MKTYKLFLLFILSLLMMVWSACSDFVDEVDPIIDQVPDDRLNDESQMPFLIQGVQVRFSTMHDQMVTLSEGLGDAFFFDSNVPNATFPTFRDIDVGDIQFDNNSVDGLYNDIGELRFFADDLVRRTGEITFSDDELKKQALFTGYFFGGIARYVYATYIGLNPDEGGGVIDGGPFIPSDQMYDLALEKFQQALQNMPGQYSFGANSGTSDYWTRVVNSVIARTLLYKGDAASAQTFAQNGMVEGDPPFQSLHSNESTNLVWQQAGRGRTQYVVDPRFKGYIDADSTEANRIQIEEILGNDGVTIFYRQIKYDNFDSPIDFMSWQENELMLAELELTSNNASALARVNNVRASHDITPLNSIDKNGLIVERDKELFLTGARLPDERRFGIFHLPPGKWRYLPITQNERNSNPNL
ncbi:MAG: hypothetical protein D6813_06535 [Calditrichaeota bacterium]|nr:MAG: hypothetical protein D6813_06535 [Calditrichota bacterium]